MTAETALPAGREADPIERPPDPIERATALSFDELAREASTLRDRINRFRTALGRFFVAKQPLIDLMCVAAVAQDILTGRAAWPRDLIWLGLAAAGAALRAGAGVAAARLALDGALEVGQGIGAQHALEQGLAVPREERRPLGRRARGRADRALILHSRRRRRLREGARDAGAEVGARGDDVRHDLVGGPFFGGRALAEARGRHRRRRCPEVGHRGADLVDDGGR